MRIFLSGVLVGCGGGQSPPDGGPVLTPHHYIITSETLPTGDVEPRNVGLDLNADTVVDNKFGNVTAKLAALGLDQQTPLDRSIDRGHILMLAELSVEDFAMGSATFTLFAGDNPQPPACNDAADTICRHHLDGSASFDIAASSPRDTPLSGTIDRGLSTTILGGRLQVQTTMLTDTPIALDLISARVQMPGADEHGFTGVLAGAITQTDLDTKILPQWQIALDALIQRDCLGPPPDCACAAASSGKSMHNIFDLSPRDCTITVDEIRNNPLLQDLLTPDIPTIDGGAALSVGVGVRAIAATFTP